MKSMKRFFVLPVLAVLVSPFFLAADATDILPLGPSKYKYLIDKIEKDQIVRTSSGQTVTLQDIVKQNAGTDVFIIGEAHDSYHCHTFQRDFIETLYQAHPKLIVGFEFFWREDDELLEQWRNGRISEDELIEKTGWYGRGGQNYGYTRLIMETIKKYKIKTIGLNVPRSILHTVSRKGYDQLAPEEKELFPTIDIPNPEHEYFIKFVFGTFAAQVPMWFKNIYSAQKCWDVIMAESMRQKLAKKEFKGYKGVVIAGSNHVDYKLGIPFRYRKAAKKANIVTIVPVLMPEEKKEEKKEDEDEEEVHPMMKMMGKSLPPAAVFSRGIADYVFAADHPPYYHFPVLGVTLKKTNDKFEVTRVAKESIAWKNGIRKGDRVTAVDGVEVVSLEQLRLALARKNWADSVTLGVVKKIEIKKE